MLLLGLASLLVLAGTAGSAGPPISVTCNGGACSAGWYQANVTVAFSWDPTGVTATNGCNTTTVSSDTAGVTFTCALTYSNGATSSLPVTIERDATPPAVSGASAGRGPDANGWYNHPVGVTFNGTDATSGLAGCAQPSYGGPDTSAASLAGTCIDHAGNVSPSFSFGPFKYDATPPSASVAISRGPDVNGWYNHPVSFGVAGSDNLSGLAGCSSGTYGGPDGAGVGLAGSCRDNAGNVGSGGQSINYDATPPTVAAASSDRPPDSNGWFNHAVKIAFTGSDTTSGGVTCDSATYDGPDTPGVTINGGCRDAAGNAAGGGSFSLKYDGTPPQLTNLSVDWDDGSATLGWTASPDTKSITIERAPGTAGAAASVVFEGLASRFEDKDLTNKVTYVYTISGFDEAGNKASETVSIVPGAKLFSPARGTTLSVPPLLAWREVATASYYNVQVFFGVSGNAFRRIASVNISGRKVLSVWPHQPRYRMAKVWKFKGKRYALPRGHYRWYVWPGEGKPAAKKYGPLIGQSDFFVVKRSSVRRGG